MRFEIVSIEGREDDRAVRLSLEPAGQRLLIPERFEVGAEIEAEVFDGQPDMARYLAALSEARNARNAHEECRSGDGAHHEDRALDLLLGEIDP